jgi:hypothetical protein
LKFICTYMFVAQSMHCNNAHNPYIATTRGRRAGRSRPVCLVVYYMTCRAVDQTGLDLFAWTIITVVRNGPSTMESSSDKKKMYSWCLWVEHIPSYSSKSKILVGGTCSYLTTRPSLKIQYGSEPHDLFFVSFQRNRLCYTIPRA